MKKPKENIHPVDAYAGEQLRKGRVLRGLSQADVGIGLQRPVTFQQVQKYERGYNRIAVSRLYEFAELLNLPFDYFLPNRESPVLPFLSPQEIKLLETYSQLSPNVQGTLTALLHAMRSS